MSDERYCPFSNGSQWYDWQGANCERCTKNDTDESGEFVGTDCDILNALTYAAFDDGTVDHTIAQRMGLLDNRMTYCWMCPEVEWTERWKATVLARREEEARDAS